VRTITRILLATAATIIAPAAAHAQAAVIVNDTKCDGFAGIAADKANCPVVGYRETKVLSQTITTLTGNNRRITGEYDVYFGGTFWNNGSNFHTNGIVNGTVRYTGILNQYTYNTTTVPSGFPYTDGSYPVFQFYKDVRDISLTYLDYRNTLRLSYQGVSNTPFVVSTPNPTAIANGNTVDIVGRWVQTNENAFEAGVAGGTASALAVAPTWGSEGPLYLQPAITSVTTTTRLDYSGLLAPKIEVTGGGINMGNSKISNLQAGTASNDAVTMAQLLAATSASARGESVAQALGMMPSSVAEAQYALAYAVESEQGQTQMGARAQAIDTDTRAALDAEAALRASADTRLEGQIGQEAATRAAADVSLSQRVAASEASNTQLATGLANETSSRIAADMALATQVGALGSRLDQMDSRLDRLDDHMASSTAVAVALGGATFLPDKHFNLTANVATYDGAHAGAFQFGALLTPNVAVNAGVATGFNRRGKTAGRAGFTIGW
jgi:hypothetical protein